MNDLLQNLVGKKLKCGTEYSVEFLSLLGLGASGAVYRVSRTLLQDGKEQLLAAKIIDIRQLHMLPEWEREREKLKREVSILASICHSGVINLHGVIDTENMLVLLMDLVEGGELFSRVAKGPLSEVQARYVFTQVAHTLKFLHEKGFIHRDLKLENVLVSQEVVPGFYEVRVADFGLSKAIVGNISRARSYVGTPQYWAPEVIMAARTKKTYTFAADIWSLGCLLYVLVGGSYPFNCDHDWETEVLKGDVVFGPGFAGVSAACRELILGMLRVNPEERYGLKEILSSAWMLTPFPSNVPPLPILQPLEREPLRMNMGPLFTGAKEEAIELVDASSIGNQKKEITHIVPTTDTKNIIPEKTRSRRRQEYMDGVTKLFNSSDMLELLVSAFYRFHQAYVVFRSQPRVAPRIRTLLEDLKEVTLASRKVFLKIEFTCSEIKDLLETVRLCIEEGRPEAAVDMFENLLNWVREVLASAESLRAQYSGALRKASSLISFIRDCDTSQFADLHPSQQLMLEAAAGAVAEHTPLGPQQSDSWRQAIFQEASADDQGDMSQAVLDMLFVGGLEEAAMLPEIEHSPRQTDLDDPMEEDHTMLDQAADDEGLREQTSLMPVPRGAAGTDLLMGQKDPSPFLRRAALLVKGIQGLQHLVDVLEQCAGFWDNLLASLEMVRKFRDQTVSTLKCCAGSQRQEQRLIERIGDYEGFWDRLETESHRFVEGSTKSADTMRRFVANFNQTLVRANAAATYYDVSRPSSPPTDDPRVMLRWRASQQSAFNSSS